MNLSYPFKEWYKSVRRKNISFFILFIISLSFLPCKSYSQSTLPDYQDGIIYVKVFDTSGAVFSLSSPDLAPLILSYEIFFIETPFTGENATLDRIYRFSFLQVSKADSLISELEALSYVEYAEKIPLQYIVHLPNDINTLQWGLYKINAPGAWDFTKGSSVIKIAVLDNAIRITHNDLAGNIWVNPGETPGNGLDDDLNGYTDDTHGYDVADGDNNPNPPPVSSTGYFVHGTHVSGIASAVTNNGTGIASIGYNIKIMPVKCSPDNSQGDVISNADDGIYYAMRSGADVINMSFGSSNSSFTQQTLINYAVSDGIVIAASAGNDNTNTNFYPAAYNNVIGVGATNQSDQKSGFSNYGPAIDVMAPGSGIFSLLGDSDNSYGSLSGTSMACPFVSGLCGLLISFAPDLTPAQVEYYLEAGCDDIDGLNAGLAGQLGEGRINAYNSLMLINLSDGENFPENKKVFVFPNPVVDRLNIIITDSVIKLSQITIFNSSGQPVIDYPINDFLKWRTIDVSGIEGGIYFIQMISDKQEVYGQKLIVVR